MLRFLSILLAGCLCQLALSGAAEAKVSLSAATYRVAETDAQATVTVVRTGSRHGDEYVRYGTHTANAVAGTDYEDVRGTLHFLPGQAQVTFTDRFGAWNGPSPAGAVFQFLRNANVQDPASVPTLATYWIVNGQCVRGGSADSPRRVAAYERFINGLSAGIGNFRAVLFLEMDALITTPCLHGGALATRMSELRYAITTLAQNPHLVVYVDAGAGDALSYRTAARLLTRAGIRQAQGFFLNSTHFDWTAAEIAYGQKLARAKHGVHFVVSTSDNGQGPLRPRDRVHQGNEILCAPPGRGLGPKPTSSTGFTYADAFAWIALPGKSGGSCGPGVKAPPTGAFWPANAVGLVRHADYGISGPGKRRLLRVR